MAAMTDYLENALANHVLRNQTYTSPSTVYLALFTSETTDSGGGTEVSGGGYQRQAVTFGEPSNGATSNTADIVFPVATANWGTITHFAICDAATSGNRLIHGPLNASKQIQASDQFIVRAGDLTVTFD